MFALPKIKTRLSKNKNYLKCLFLSVSLLLISCINNIGLPNNPENYSICISYPTQKEIRTLIDDVTTTQTQTCQLEVNPNRQVIYRCLTESDSIYTESIYINLYTFVQDFVRPGSFTKLSRYTYLVNDILIPSISTVFTYENNNLLTQESIRLGEEIIFSVDSFNDDQLVQNMSILVQPNCQGPVGNRSFNYSALENNFTQVQYLDTYTSCILDDPNLTPPSFIDTNISQIYNSRQQLVYEIQIENENTRSVKEITILAEERICINE